MPPKKAPTGARSNYKIGIRAENKVKKLYESNGFDVQQSAGSRGAADLKCTKGNKCHYVQVKTTTKPSNTPYIPPGELGRLKSTATRNGATSVVAKVPCNGEPKLTYAKNNNSVNLD